MSTDGFDLFDQLEAEHRRERLAEAMRRNEAVALAEAKAAAEAKARTDENSARFNLRMRWRDYIDAGVAPPITDEAGNPTVSLPFLKQMGWKIESFGGENVLVKPMFVPPGRLQSQV